MKKTKCIFYLADDYIYLYYQNNTTKYKLKNYLYEGRIIKQNYFIKQLNKITKEKHLIKLFEPLNVKIIYEPHLKYIDKKIILNTFETCGFRDIKLFNCIQLLSKNKRYILLNNNYLLYIYNKEYFKFNMNKFLDFEKIIKIITNNIDEDMILLGINKEIDKYTKIKDNIYYLENSDTYFIDLKK